MGKCTDNLSRQIPPRRLSFLRTVSPWDATLDVQCEQPGIKMAPSAITEDYYAILEVQQNATSEQITKSYRRLALKLHPDRKAEGGSTQAFQLVS